MYLSICVSKSTCTAASLAGDVPHLHLTYCKFLSYFARSFGSIWLSAAGYDLFAAAAGWGICEMSFVFTALYALKRYYEL